MKIHPQLEKLSKGKNPIDVGVYEDLVLDTSTAVWDKQGFPPRRRSQRKTWYFGGFYNEKIMAGMAVVDAGFVSNAFVYFFIPEKNIFIEDKLTIPYFFSESFDPSLYSDWVMKNYSITTKGNETTLSYIGKFHLSLTIENNNSGLSFICPSKGRPFNFTFKNISLPSKIKIEIDGETYESEGDFGTVDFSKGYPPRHTFWNWASIVGKTLDGQIFGANLLDGHNDKYENAAWVGEDRILLPLADFTYTNGERIDKEKWFIKSQNGDLETTFTPLGLRKENLNALIMKSNFIQCFGKFEGRIKHQNKWVEFVGYGPTEEHEALW